MDEYNEQIGDKDHEKYADHIVDILDHFNHLLTFHDADDDQFDAIFQLFGGQCALNKCSQIRAHYRNYEQDVDNKLDQSTEENDIVGDIFAQIHCYIHHQYHTGFRLTNADKEIISNDEIKNCNDGDEKTESSNSNAFLRMKGILRERCRKSEKILSLNYTNSKNTKFTTSLNKTMTFNDTNDQKSSSMISYSYSYPFIYDKRAKNYQAQFTLGKWCDFYVRDKYKSFKEELLQNEICSLESIQWKGLMNIANQLINTQNARRSIANTAKYKIDQIRSPEHPYHFGYKDKETIKRKHLIAVRAYCEFDNLQNKFSETFRKTNNNQKLRDVIKIHSNYHHFAKTLKEAITVFGIQYQEHSWSIKGEYKYYKKFYCGIDKEMIFNSTNAVIHGPLSTSWSVTTAAQFSSDEGMILALVPNPELKYFDCKWISRYPKEGEFLFMGGFESLNFIDIIHTKIGDTWTKKYIKVLRLIETMARGNFFMNSPSDIHPMKEQKTTNVASMQLSSLSGWDRGMCRYMMSHQMAKNGYFDKSKNIKLYPEIFEEVPYVEKLLNNICNGQKTLEINMAAMNTKTLKECDLSCGGGYIGYNFCKLVFLSDNYQGINIDMFQKLFPNVSYVRVTQLEEISSDFLDAILSVLSKDSSISYMELHLVKSYGDNIDAESKCSLFEKKFELIGFESFIQKHPSFQTKCMVIYRKKKYVS